MKQKRSSIPMHAALDKLVVWYGHKRAENHPLLNSSQVFCMAPWVQLHAQTNGNVGPCCMANLDANALGNLNENPSLSAHWNAEKMRALRQGMLKGEPSDLCMHCYKHEQAGKFSERQVYNRDFKVDFHRVLSTRGDGSIPQRTVPVIDIRFSNRCNYKCRICSSEYSSLWHDEELRLDPDARPYPKSLKVAADEQVFWESFEELLPDVRRLHFAGGEPLVMDEHYRTLEHLISIGKTDLTLTYNTNFSQLGHKGKYLPDLWSRFSSVHVWASLDGMGARGDYQRKGQRWETVEENIRTVQRECPRVLFGVNMTVSVFNALHIPDFYRHLVGSGLVSPERVNLYPLFTPEHFHVGNLTDGLKDLAEESYKELLNDYLEQLPDTDGFSSQLRAITNMMRSRQCSQLLEFRQAVRALDRLRSECFEDTFPELAEMLPSEN